ncbi:MAG TPA: peroxiredoxin [Candidatus Acidoferrales bacterium]|nr:peroxiredoxin [Candidatus Acidoferrales bacterium]
MSHADPAFPLPDDLPVPQDDGGCSHLVGMALPRMTLRSTAGRDVDLSQLTGRTVVYCYPLTGRPGVALPTGWNDIPGARGCTPESCGFRDHYHELAAHGATAVFGFSTQDTDYQREAAERLHLPFELLSDADWRFVNALKLPTFEVDGMTLVKRLTLVVRDGHVEHVFYPVFPPDGHAAEVITWLRAHVSSI